MNSPSKLPATVKMEVMGGPANPDGRVGIGHSANPFHAELHAANSQRLKDIDKAKEAAISAMKTPNLPKVPGLGKIMGGPSKLGKIPGMPKLPC